MSYETGRKIFFSEFHDTEEVIAACVQLISNDVAAHINRAYLNSGFTKKIQENLETALQFMSKAVAAADALSLSQDKSKYQGWHDQVLKLIMDVGAVYSSSVVERGRIRK